MKSLKLSQQIRSWILRNQVELKLFFSVWLVYAVFATPAGGVTPNRYVDLIHAIVNEGRFEIDTYHENTDDKAFYDGHYYAGALPGPSILSIPSYLVFREIYRIIPESVKEKAAGVQSFKYEKEKDSNFYGQVDNVEFFLSQGFMVVFSVSLFSAASVLIFFMILGLLEIKDPVRQGLTLVFAFGTIVFWHATWFFEQSFTIFFLLTSFYLLLSMNKKAITTMGLLLAGLLAGSGLTVEFSAAIAGILLFGYLIFTHRKPNALLFWIGYAIPVALLMTYNFINFDNPFSTPYQHLAGQAYQGIIQEGFVGVSYPRIDRIIGLMVSPSRGLFLFAPITLFGILGMVQPSKEKQKFKVENYFFIAMTVAAFLYVGAFRGWNAGGAFGPRYMLFGIPFIIIPSAFFFEKYPIRFLYIIGLVSILINWTGVQYGFATSYYENLEKFLTLGPTLPAFESIESHQVQSNHFLNILVRYQIWWTVLIHAGLLLIVRSIWNKERILKTS